MWSQTLQVFHWAVMSRRSECVILPVDFRRSKTS